MSQTATAFRVGIIMAAEKIALVEAAAFADREHGPWPLTFHFGAKTGAPGQSSVDAGSVGGGGGAMVGQVRHHQNLT